MKVKENIGRCFCLFSFMLALPLPVRFSCGLAHFMALLSVLSWMEVYIFVRVLTHCIFYFISLYIYACGIQDAS
jgi:hypothetical protein